MNRRAWLVFLHVGLLSFLLGCFDSPCWGAGVKDYLKKPGEWFEDSEAKKIAANVLSFQSDLGGWPKNTDTAGKPYRGDREKLKPTYDNGATTDELRFLAKIFNATGDETYRRSFERGLDYVLDGQYANGGWPQSHPPGTGYPRHITFNDHAMVRLCEFVREVADSDEYAFVDADRRAAAGSAFTRAIDCILRCQIRIDGELTVWCAQHDEVDFRPQTARSYELPTFSGSESVGIVRLLMSLESPSDEVVRAVEAAVAWFERSKLTGIRVLEVKDADAPGGRDRIVESDPDAPPIWARFYELESGRPIFVDRDGVPKYRLAEIGHERRNGYGWYGTWPQKVLDKEYAEWKGRLR